MARGTVVVGVDPSLGVLAAVSWAAAEAARRGARLHLVEVRPTGGGTTDAHRSAPLRRARAVAAAVAPGNPVSAESIAGAIGPVLRARARDADLLVIGSRRHTDPSTVPDGTTPLLLAGAVCPTVVVPSRWAGSWASTPSARPIVVGLAGTPQDPGVQTLAGQVVRRLGVELVSVWPRRRRSRDREDGDADLTGALLDVGRWAQLIVVSPSPVVHLDRLLRRSPCAVMLPPSVVARPPSTTNGGSAVASTRGAWLSPEGYEHAVAELDRLLLTHRSSPRRLDDEGPDGLALREWRERRIRDLQELLLAGDAGRAPEDDGVAEPGMVLTVRLDDDPEPEVFLLAHGGPLVSAALDVYSPDSPIGRALLGARPGDVRTATVPSGAEVRLTVLSATPLDRYAREATAPRRGHSPVSS
jgi:transcription elongation GreA/GreB family factor/nucleotide-binding universal stress UspA family protein